MDSINIRPQEMYSILLGTNVLYHRPSIVGHNKRSSVWDPVVAVVVYWAGSFHHPTMQRRERFSVNLGVLFFLQLLCDFRQGFCKECLDLCFRQGVVEPSQIRDVTVEGIPMVWRLSDD